MEWRSRDNRQDGWAGQSSRVAGEPGPPYEPHVPEKLPAPLPMQGTRSDEGTGVLHLLSRCVPRGCPTAEQGLQECGDEGMLHICYTPEQGCFLLRGPSRAHVPFSLILNAQICISIAICFTDTSASVGAFRPALQLPPDHSRALSPLLLPTGTAGGAAQPCSTQTCTLAQLGPRVLTRLPRCIQGERSDCRMREPGTGRPPVCTSTI